MLRSPSLRGRRGGGRDRRDLEVFDHRISQQSLAHRANGVTRAVGGIGVGIDHDVLADANITNAVKTKCL